MHSTLKKIFLCYAAGTFGGLANFVFGALLAGAGIFSALGIHMPPPAMPGALYQRLVWGGIWGWILLLPVPKTKLWSHGFLLGVGPSLLAGIWVFPHKLGAGYFGIHLGMAMPVLIFIFNWVWGVVTLASFKRTT